MPICSKVLNHFEDILILNFKQLMIRCISIIHLQTNVKLFIDITQRLQIDRIIYILCITYMISNVWNPLFPRLLLNTNIENVFPNSPRAPTITIATPSVQYFACSLRLSASGS